MSGTYRFGIVAGEKSGDILGGSLMAAMKNYFPNAEFVGVGGSEMISLGCESLCSIERLSVMGFIEPLSRLPELLFLKKKTTGEICKGTDKCIYWHRFSRF